MIRTIISDIGNVLSGFTWYDFYKSKGYSEEMVERLAKATVKSDAWKEYDRGVLSEEEILNRFIANDPELEEEFEPMKQAQPERERRIPYWKWKS